jgi:hypothetical protein
MRAKFSVAALTTAGIVALTVPAVVVVAGGLRAGPLALITLTNGTNATFGTTLAPGATPTASGTLIATDTSTTWTLQVKDSSATTPGKLDAAGGPTCAGSESSLASAVSVAVSGAGTSAGAVSISGTNQTVASAGGGNPTATLSATTLTTSYTQPIAATELLTAGCVYSLTATYTLS